MAPFHHTKSLYTGTIKPQLCPGEKRVPSTFKKSHFYCKRKREIQRQEKEKRSLEESPADRKLLASHRVVLVHKLGLSFHPSGAANLQSQSISKTFMFWLLFFRPAAKQEWHWCLGHQSPPSGIHTPLKQVKSHKTEKQALTVCCPQC